MQNKGIIGWAVIIGVILCVVTAAIGIQIVNDVVFPACHGTGRSCYANHNFTNAAYYALPDSNIETGTARMYNASTCTGALIPAANYTMNLSAGGVIMTDNAYNASNQSIRYSAYVSGYWLGGGIRCTIVDNFAILFAVGLLVLAASWFWLKS